MDHTTAPVPAEAAGDGARMSSLAIGLLSLLIFTAMMLGSIQRSHGFGGILGGLMTAVVTAGLFAFLGNRVLNWLITPGRQSGGDETDTAHLEGVLGPTLAELEATRADTVRQVNARMALRVPLGLAAGVAYWCFDQFGNDPGGVVDLLAMSGAGGGLGYFWASHQLSERYRALYKARVLPRLAARFGQLDYRAAVVPDAATLRGQGIFADFDDVEAEDEIFGEYRGMPVSIIELKLTDGSGKERRTVFYGLVARVTLPRRLAGTTMIIADGGLFGNLIGGLRASGRKPVKLEDPVFEAAYQVYATDQIAARALLTPAFMERLLALGERAGFMRPLALAEDNLLTIALPKMGYDNLFEPPGYREPAKSRAALVKLDADVSAVLRAADAIIDLDQFSRAVAAAD